MKTLTLAILFALCFAVHAQTNSSNVVIANGSPLASSASSSPATNASPSLTPKRPTPEQIAAWKAAADAAREARTIRFAWDAPSDTNVIGCRIRIGHEPMKFYFTNCFVPYVTNFTFARVKSQDIYFFRLTWFYCDGTEGGGVELGYANPTNAFIYADAKYTVIRFFTESNDWSVTKTTDGTNWTPVISGAPTTNIVCVVATNAPGSVIYKVKH